MEIGGYLEFERYKGEEYHTGCIKLNTARNGLKYLIEARGIKKLWLSRWNCSAVLDICNKSGIEIGFYELDSSLKPVMPSDYQISDYVYVVNYYGQISDVYYKHMIFDNVQAFFQKPKKGIDTIYTCRKYFGVTDGAYLYTNSRIGYLLEQDCSWNRIGYLAGRLEKSGSDFYDAYQDNEILLDSLPLKRMSAFTENILKSIDYEYVRKRREENYKYIHEKLGDYNRMQVASPIGPFAYPFMITEGEILRKYLQKNKIYIAKLWPNVKHHNEAELAENILPIPCDQRYSINSINFVCETILDYINGGLK